MTTTASQLTGFPTLESAGTGRLDPSTDDGWGPKGCEPVAGRYGSISVDTNSVRAA